MTVLERVTRRLDFNTLLVVAAVTETATGFMHKGEAEITYYSNPYRIEFFPNMPDNFKPGFGSYPVKVFICNFRLYNLFCLSSYAIHLLAEIRYIYSEYYCD
ncbi:hypothetical protein DPMN_108721 [Dreissena polymorpha]|uniref:Uncharacterized protein n=1 Tax=Dreissena polymorpha TaxID=45954 RepID=A0A9D4K9D2_DREPO|nr:hypothetical protein DPMN_108721 [Dreissena polymorpha]